MHISYMGLQATCPATVTCILWIYYLIGHRPVASSASSTGGQSHSPLVVCCAAIPTIFLTVQWCNPSRTFSMDPVTTQLFITTPTAQQIRTTYPTPEPLTPSYSPPSPLLTTAPSEDSDTKIPSRYCYRRLCILVMEMLRPAPEALLPN